ncbi:MAG: preprotein translocase subunit SecE [Candidatus Paceibacterota bacterium]|jgi:preprotein translocase subunit SecE
MNIIKSLKNYIVDVKTETRKVSWPTKKRATRDSAIVVFISVAMAVFLGGVDYLLTYLIETYIVK